MTFTIFSTGICTEEVMKAAPLLKEKGLSVEHVHVTTLKPFTDPQISISAAKAKLGVITMENHTILGGLGTCVAERMAEDGIRNKLTRIGLPDQYLHGSSKKYLMREYELDALGLVKQLEIAIGQKFGIPEDKLIESETHVFYDDKKTEAL